MELTRLKESGSDYSKMYEDVGVQKEAPGALRRYSKTVYATFFFMVIEILGGILSRSVAVVATGAMLGIEILTAFVRMCGAMGVDRRENKDFTFGYRRVEPLGIVLETSFIWFCMVLLLLYSYYMHQTTNEEKPLRPYLMLGTAIVSLIGDFARVIVVHGPGVLRHLFSYPFMTKKEREDIKIRKGNKETSLRRIFEKIKGPLFYDLFVFAISILITLTPAFAVLDKLSILVLIGLVFYSTMPEFKRNFKILMEGNLRPQKVAEIKAGIKEITLVHKLESLKIWVLEEGYFAACVHVSSVSNPNESQPYYQITRRVGAVLERHGISYWTVQVWPNDGLSLPKFRDDYLDIN